MSNSVLNSSDESEINYLLSCNSENAESSGVHPIKSADENPKSSSETELGSSRRSSAVAFLNYIRECKRRFGSKHLGQGFANAATKRWRAMSPEHRARYRRSEYRSARSTKPSKSSLLCSEEETLDSTGALSVVPSGFSLDKDCHMKRKSKRSCSKPRRKKSACGKRRRRKSACKKRKSRKSKKSCSKPRRRKSRKAKCKGGAPH
ncbi:histone-like protein 18C isoform X3 [Drosophila pseudoobscura]|uniref:Histone-like protein 18C isoform X3 n=1 Tax=Drosophila pseudoobscura pseudoobscura TaxID=46245 RepID=A0A6I8VE23_DROPS|nr:histone-like protein 18C isoform X3 [Drosophila pseudoobscura]